MRMAPPELKGHFAILLMVTYRKLHKITYRPATDPNAITLLTFARTAASNSTDEPLQ